MKPTADLLGSFTGPDIPGPSERSELCRICHRRMGEHEGVRGTYCPDDGTGERNAVFVGSGQFGQEGADLERCWRELEERRRGRVAVYRRRTEPDRSTGAPRTAGFDLVEYRDKSGRRTP